MDIAAVMEATTHLLTRKDLIGSDRLEYRLSPDAPIRYAEFIGIPKERDGQDKLYDILLLHGRRGNNFTGLFEASFVRRNLGFYSVVQLFDTIETGFQIPDTGEILAPSSPLVKFAQATQNDRGVYLRLTEGSQNHFTNCRDYDVYLVRENKRRGRLSEDDDYYNHRR